jgi:hypothetical protein
MHTRLRIRTVRIIACLAFATTGIAAGGQLLTHAPTGQVQLAGTGATPVPTPDDTPWG